ncbi:MAG: hypothetical protein ACREVY_18370 [Gammaproteobacteria bacterium]
MLGISDRNARNQRSQSLEYTAIYQVMEWKAAPQQLVNACHYAVERTRTGLLDLRTKYGLSERYEDPDLPWMQETQREKAQHAPQGGGLEAPPSGGAT